LSSINWEKTYSSGGHINSWPFSDLISLYYWYCNNLQQKENLLKVFEFGMGTGNNYPFWRALNVDYSGIEYSSSAVRICLEKFPELINRIQIGDFTSALPDKEKYDVICDRAAVTCNNNAKLQRAIDNSFQLLKKGGIFLGVDWYSKNHSDFFATSTNVDANTKCDFLSGQFKGVGAVHFANYADMLDIFKNYEILHLSEKVVTNYFRSDKKDKFASWNIVARKPL